MSKIFKLLLLILFISFSHSAFSQTNKEKAEAKYRDGIKLVDNGKYDEGIRLYQEALKFDPDNILYLYEIGYTYYAQGNYDKAADQFEELTDRSDTFDQVYSMLGNSYDILGKSEKAMKTYDEGLKKFPKSGSLYLEKANVFNAHKKYEEALKLYEKGIQVEPAFPSNYYWASIFYCSSDQKVWGLIYGEIFMNLEPNSKRTETISKLLFDTYDKGISIKDTNNYSISLYKRIISGETDKDKLTTFGSFYETTYLLSAIGEKRIQLNSLDRLRTKFLKIYFESGKNVEYPNVLFDYQKKVMDAGHLETYNKWIVSKGMSDDFEEWKAANKDKWDAFLVWFVQNPLKLDANHKFWSGQY